MSLPLSVQDIFRARQRIAPYVWHTPLRQATAISRAAGAAVFLKLENWQPTGSFKVRGAVNFLCPHPPAPSPEAKRHASGEGEQAHPPAPSPVGTGEGEQIVTASAGNHALAVGYAARCWGWTRGTVFVPTTAPRAKVEKLRGFPLEVREVGLTYDDAHHAAEEFQRATGATFVHAYDDPRTVAGAGTLGLEILEDLPDVDAILVPVGGGGMSAGIAIAVKMLAPRVKFFGVNRRLRLLCAIRCAITSATRNTRRDRRSRMGWQAGLAKSALRSRKSLWTTW